MKKAATRFYRWWRALNRQGLIEGDFEGLRKSKKAEAIGFLVAMAPTAPLMISDISGRERDWLWYIWCVIAGSWLIGITGVILFQSGKTFVRYCRDWNRQNR